MEVSGRIQRLTCPGVSRKIQTKYGNTNFRYDCIAQTVVTGVIHVVLGEPEEYDHSIIETLQKIVEKSSEV